MKRRYAICGVSNRSVKMYIGPILQTFSKQAEIVGLLDVDARRFDVCKSKYPELSDVLEYGADDFDKMIEQTNPDVIIVTGVMIRT